MAVKVTKSFVCDICGLNDAQVYINKQVTCAVKKMGYYAERFSFSPSEEIELHHLDLCEKCKKKTRSRIVGYAMYMFSNDKEYKFYWGKKEQKND